MPREIMRRLYGNHRPFWLLVALAVALLMGISATAHAEPGRERAGIADLLRGIERDLAALRIELELVGADDAEPITSLREQIALSPGLADGGRIFRLRSMEAMVRSLSRRVDRLIEAQHRTGNDRGLDIARLMSLDARSVQWGIEELRFAREPHLLRVAQERIGRALDEVARGTAAVTALHTQAALRPPRAGAAG